MGIEAFIWSYSDGDVAPLPFDKIQSLFAKYVVDWDSTNGRMRVCFGDESTSCDVYCGPEAEASNSVNGLMISRPVNHPDLWQCVLDVMRMGNVLLFFSDKTTPLFAFEDAPKHFPKDLLEALGKPRIVQSSEDIIQSHET